MVQLFLALVVSVSIADPKKCENLDYIGPMAGNRKLYANKSDFGRKDKANICIEFKDGDEAADWGVAGFTFEGNGETKVSNSKAYRQDSKGELRGTLSIPGYANTSKLKIVLAGSKTINDDEKFIPLVLEDGTNPFSFTDVVIATALPQITDPSILVKKKRVYLTYHIHGQVPVDPKKQYLITSKEGDSEDFKCHGDDNDKDCKLELDATGLVGKVLSIQGYDLAGQVARLNFQLNNSNTEGGGESQKSEDKSNDR